jgi:hypothetical protein
MKDEGDGAKFIDNLADSFLCEGRIMNYFGKVAKAAQKCHSS